MSRQFYLSMRIFRICTFGLKLHASCVILVLDGRSKFYQDPEDWAILTARSKGLHSRRGYSIDSLNRKEIYRRESCRRVGLAREIKECKF